MADLDPDDFPAADSAGYKVTSPESRRYNCIAWASGEMHRPWWPNAAPDAYWPPAAPNRVTISAFVKTFEGLGYSQCRYPNLENGYTKLALYALNQEPTHMARQLDSGAWTSKMGIENIDIEHATLEALEGPMYGTVVRILKKKNPTP